MFKFLPNFHTFLKIPSTKKIEAVISKLLVQSLEKFLLIWNRVTKTNPNFVNFRSFLKISNIFISREKKDIIPDNLLTNFSFQ